MKTIILFAVFMTMKVASGTDPAKCQRFIKYQLITTCGATKRHSHLIPSYNYPVMDLDEIEQRYWHMVASGVIKGIDFPEDGYPNWDEDEHPNLDGNRIADENNFENGVNQLMFIRRKRQGVFGSLRTKDPVGNEKIRAYHGFGIFPNEGAYKSPVPGELTAKCCGDELCPLEVFKGFCE